MELQADLVNRHISPMLPGLDACNILQRSVIFFQIRDVFWLKRNPEATRFLQRPGMTQSRLLPTVLLAASSWLLISLFGSQQSLGATRHREHLASPVKRNMVQDGRFFCLPVSQAEVEDLLPGGHFSSGIHSSEPNRHARLQG